MGNVFFFYKTQERLFSNGYMNLLPLGIFYYLAVIIKYSKQWIDKASLNNFKSIYAFGSKRTYCTIPIERNKNAFPKTAVSLKI